MIKLDHFLYATLPTSFAHSWGSRGSISFAPEFGVGGRTAKQFSVDFNEGRG